MPQLNVRVKRFTRTSLNIGDVKLAVFKIVGEDERQVNGDPVDIAARMLEEETRSDDVNYILLEISGQGFKNYLGEGSRSGGAILFPKPSRLLRVGIVRLSKLEVGEDASYYKFRDDHVEWFNVAEEVYVFDSIIEAPSDIAYLILDTADGRSIIKLQRFSPPSLSYQLRSQQDLLSESSEAESGGGNSLA